MAARSLELTAWGNESYRQRDNSFVPILTDGTNIEGIVIEQGSSLRIKGDKVVPLFAGPAYFWLYATAYRLTGDEFIWQMVKDIAIGNNLGDIDEMYRKAIQSPVEIACSDPYGLLGFLELYDKTKQEQFLIMARRIADNIVETRFHEGFFVLSEQHVYSRFDCFEPLALLHLVEAIDTRKYSIPTAWP